jgi:hypothetical protein
MSLFCEDRTRKITGFTEGGLISGAGRVAGERRAKVAQKRNAARAEYNRSAALVIPEAPKIPPTLFCLREGC